MMSERIHNLLDLTKEQAAFLYRLLDQVSVSGEENKAMIVEIMRALRKTQEKDAGSVLERVNDD